MTDSRPLLLTESPQAVIDPVFPHVLPFVHVPVGCRETDQVEEKTQTQQGEGDLDGQRQFGHGAKLAEDSGVCWSPLKLGVC